MTIRRLVQAALITGVVFCVLAIGSSAAWAGPIYVQDSLAVVLGTGFSVTMGNNTTFSNFTSNIPLGSPDQNDVNFYSPLVLGTFNEFKVALVPSPSNPLAPGGGPYTFAFDVTLINQGTTPAWVYQVGVGIDGVATTDTKVISSGASTYTIETGPTPAYGNPVFTGVGNLQTFHISETIALSPAGSSVTSVTDYFEETTVPEPATFSLIGGALMGLGLLGRKKLFRG